METHKELKDRPEILAALEAVRKQFVQHSAPSRQQTKWFDANLILKNKQIDRTPNTTTGHRQKQARRIYGAIEASLGSDVLYMYMFALPPYKIASLEWRSTLQKWWKSATIPMSLRDHISSYSKATGPTAEPLPKSPRPQPSELTRLCEQTLQAPPTETNSQASAGVSQPDLTSADPNEQPTEGAVASNRPTTTAQGPDAFSFGMAKWKILDEVFAKPAIDAIRAYPKHLPDPEITEHVRSRWPKKPNEGDAVISVECGNCGILSLLRDYGAGISMAQIQEVFGDSIVKAIEESDLRQWEKSNGLTDTTNCVEVTSHIDIRIKCDPALAKSLAR